MPRFLAPFLVFCLAPHVGAQAAKSYVTGLAGPGPIASTNDGKVFVALHGRSEKDTGIAYLKGTEAVPFHAGIDVRAMAAFQGGVIVAEKDRVWRFDGKGKSDLFAPPNAFPATPSDLRGLAVDIESGAIYVADAGSTERGGTIYRITPRGLVESVVDRKLAPEIASPRALLLDGASHLLIADRGKVFRLRFADRRLEKVADGLGEIDAMTWDRHGRLYLSSSDDGTLHVIGRPGAAPVAMAVPGIAPTGVCLDPSNRQLVLADRKNGTLSLVPTGVPGKPVDDTPLAIETEVAFPKLQWEGWTGESDTGKVVPLRPIVLTHAGDGSDRVFVATQQGVIHVFPNDQQATRTRVFLDVQDRVRYDDKQNEEGLLGFAFHPRFKDTGEFFLFYTRKKAKHPHTNVLSRFRVRKDDPSKADPASEEELLVVEHPFWNHDGGTVAFGPEGYLYLAIGDGGAANDPFDHAQNLNTILGAVLRLDIDRKDPGKTYAIPKDNPFVGRKDARPEIWAYGLRNVWRLAFDPKTGRCWAGDVGQNLYEEINLLTAGGNFGWNRREGLHPFGARTVAPGTKLIDPIWEYHHDIGRSITGGSVYRGTRVPALEGHYVYADYVTGRLWALRYDEAEKRVVANRPLRDKSLNILSFGEDEKRDVYLLTTSAAGRGILRFVATSK